MNENHTNACGTEPFDHVYSLGYQVHQDVYKRQGCSPELVD